MSRNPDGAASRTMQTEGGLTSFDRRRKTIDSFDFMLPSLGKKGYGVHGAEVTKPEGHRRANSKMHTLTEKQQQEEMQAKLES